jgi:hypothetical protein
MVEGKRWEECCAILLSWMLILLGDVELSSEKSGVLLQTMSMLCDGCVEERLVLTGEKSSPEVALRNFGRSHAHQVNDKRETSAFTGGVSVSFRLQYSTPHPLFRGLISHLQSSRQLTLRPKSVMIALTCETRISLRLTAATRFPPSTRFIPSLSRCP